MPVVSVIVPCFNEKHTIEKLLDSLYRQTYEGDEMEVVIADGMSDDGTREIITAWRKQHPEFEVRVVDNPKRNIPAGLNIALRATKGELIVRMDAHSEPARDYVTRCVKAILDGCGDNVGGIWEIKPGRDNWIAISIATAAAHPIGVGGAQYRIGGAPQEVDTVPFGAYRRELVDQIGYYDETLLSNEDYEYNARIRQAGGAVWFDPEIRMVYYARGTIRDLARQYWRYGYWKVKMLRRYPDTIRLRQGLPPVFVLTCATLAILAFGLRWAQWLLALIFLFYSAILGFVGLQTAIKQRKPLLILGVPLAIAVMHFSWGSAFLRSGFEEIFSRKKGRPGI